MGGQDGILRVWTLKSGSELKQIKGSEPIHCITVSDNGDTVAVGSNSSIRIYKIQNETNSDDEYDYNKL